MVKVIFEFDFEATESRLDIFDCDEADEDVRMIIFSDKDLADIFDP